MPRLAVGIYAAHQANVLKLAAKKGGVSRSEIADALNVSKTIANNLVKQCSLELDHKEGRTEFFKTNGASPPDVPEAPELPEAVKAVAVAGDDIIEDDDDDEEIALLDAEIVDTRDALKEAALRAGKALGDWATNQSLVDALRKQMTDLAVRRMNACS